MSELERDLPTAVWSGTFRLFGVDVICHTLDNGMRIIESESMVRLLEAMENGTIDPADNVSATDFAKWQKAIT